MRFALLLLASIVFAAEPLTNEHVAKMAASGLSEAHIILAIESAPDVQFRFIPGQMEWLMKNGVSEATIKAMAVRSTRGPAVTRTVKEPAVERHPVSTDTPPPPQERKEEGPQSGRKDNGAAGRPMKIHGYVTSLYSATSFEIDEYRIMRDASLQLEFDTEEGDEISANYSKDIRVGSEIEIKGNYDEQTQSLTAKSIRVFTRESQRLKRTAMLEFMPRLEKKGSYWAGEIRVDGQTILVNEATLVSIVPNNVQKETAKRAENSTRKAQKQSLIAETEQSLSKLDDVHVSMHVSYEGVRGPSGQILATKIQFKDNELTGSEARLWKSLTPKVKAFTGSNAGELNIGKAGKYKITPTAEVQSYVRSLSERLIPESQRRLAVGDPNKIPFQFYVLEAKAPNAFATANGVVTVFAPMLETLENEAQLAFVMSHEIAHATHEHTLRQMDFHKKKRILLNIGAAFAAGYGAHNVAGLLNLAASAITNGYQRYLENQADRVAMEYMVAAGYDPREAPRAWKAMSLRHGDKPTSFWDSHDNHTTRRSYLMSELAVNQRGVAFESLKKDDPEFARIRGILRDRSTKNKKTIKLKF